MSNYLFEVSKTPFIHKSRTSETWITHTDGDGDGCEFTMNASYWDTVDDDKDRKNAIDEFVDNCKYLGMQHLNGGVCVYTRDGDKKNFLKDRHAKIRRACQEVVYDVECQKDGHHAEHAYYTLMNVIQGDYLGVWIYDEYFGYPVTLDQWLTECDSDAHYYIGTIIEYGG